MSPAAAAKSLRSCPTLCNPIDSSPPGSPVPGILQARTSEWSAISFSNAGKWKVKGKSLSRASFLHISSPNFYEGWDFSFLLLKFPFGNVATQHFPWHLALDGHHQVRLERVSDLPHLVLEPHLFTLHQPGKWMLGSQPCHPLLSSSADAGFSSSGFDEVRRIVTRVTQTCQLSKSLVVKLEERPQKTLVSTHDPSECIVFSSSNGFCF